MPATRTNSALLATVLLLALPLAGCVENVQDLKDKLAGDDSEEVLGASSTNGASSLPPAAPPANVTKPKPPVARVSLFGGAGALLFKASFAADETKVPTVVDGGSTVTLSASDSEAVDPRATLAEYKWTVAPMAGSAAKPAGGGGHGGHAHAAIPLVEGFDAGHDHGGAAPAGGAHDMTGVSVQHTFGPEGGVYVITLLVKDSLGATDLQSLLVGVNPAKVVKSVSFEGTVRAGTAYTAPAALGIDASNHVFNVSATVNELPATAEKAVLTLVGKDQRAIDLDLAVNDPAGEEAATTTETTLEMTGLSAGDWTAIVSANLGVAADYTLTVDVTYQPTHPDVQGLFGAGGDGHGGHAH